VELETTLDSLEKGNCSSECSFLPLLNSCSFSVLLFLIVEFLAVSARRDEPSKPTTDPKKKGASSIPVKKDSTGKIITNGTKKGSSLSSTTTALLNKFSKHSKQYVDMLRSLFEKMDSDKDGFLSVDDITSHFRKMGIFRSISQSKQWITSKDIDQDGKLSLEEFLSVYLKEQDHHHPQRPSSSKGSSVHPSTAAHHISDFSFSPLNVTLGCFRLVNTVQTSCFLCDCLIEKLYSFLRTPLDYSIRNLEVNLAVIPEYARSFTENLYVMIGFVSTEKTSSKLIFNYKANLSSEIAIQEIQTTIHTLESFNALLIDLSLSDPINGRFLCCLFFSFVLRLMMSFMFLTAFLLVSRSFCALCFFHSSCHSFRSTGGSC
jgi:hypothetical protein